ncbi:hypothetical protein [Acetobacter persici]|uniref:hypothetical protein n=1 Tax=Acetobacter persici TaxID=1076596 RepID=UPI001F3F1079|nr:hypothetical protein [Acetobacter persici]MCG0998150.1 hypothetical protein [Acetobacter persici]
MIDDASHSECRRLANEWLEEAERRAEQRVRAEIARDSERLDWLENNSGVSFELDQNTRKNYGNIEVRWNETDVAYGRTVRDAIDAAREVG